jgi:hypothetical protein
MNYLDCLKKHLAEYKRTQLGISEPGVFRYRGRDVLHAHILPKGDALANILTEAQPGARAFLAHNPTKRHRYFHHLNSSQAFTFNLFFPYFDGGQDSARALLRALRPNGSRQEVGVLAKWEPERLPHETERTNIDVFWRTTDDIQTFCEVKLSESDFGTATNDREHQLRLAEFYAPTLNDHLLSDRLEPQAFFGDYQFNRNVWHMVRANERSRLTFLLPRLNKGLCERLEHLRSGVVQGTKERISAVFIEDVIASLLADEQCPQPLRSYAHKLAQKYLPKCE